MNAGLNLQCTGLWVRWIALCHWEARRRRLYLNPLSTLPVAKNNNIVFILPLNLFFFFFLIDILYATNITQGWQSVHCLEANAPNKKCFPHYGNQSNVISDQHILTQRQRGEECPIDWYCLLGRSRWSPEEKTSVAGGPLHSPQTASPLFAFFPLYMSQYLGGS